MTKQNGNTNGKIKILGIMHMLKKNHTISQTQSRYKYTVTHTHSHNYTELQTHDLTLINTNISTDIPKTVMSAT